MLKPFGHKIIIKPDKVDDERDLGDGRKLQIIVNERLEKAGQIKGTLVAVGPDAWKAFRNIDRERRWYAEGDAWATLGDRVYFARYAGHYIEDPENPDEDFMIMNDEDITCLIVGDE